MNGNRVISMLGTGCLVTALALASAAPAPQVADPRFRANTEWFQLNLTPVSTPVIYPMTPSETPSSMERPPEAGLPDPAVKPPAVVQRLRRAG